jgi:hypothetical protein
MEKAFNVCLASDSAKSLQEEAGKLKDAMDGMKQKSAEDFGRLLEAAKRDPLEGERFSDAWFRGIATRVKADSASRPMPEIVSGFNADHEFEQAKLQIAVSN